MTAPDASAALAAIRAREQAATTGPWTPVWSEALDEYTVYTDDDAFREVAVIKRDDPPTAYFIAHARTDVPRMAAALDAVLALCDEAAPRRMGDGYLSASVLAPEDVRAAITDALGGGV